MQKKATLEKVRETMNDFRANGLKVTVETVTEAVGGSRSTVNPYMNTVYKEWAQEQAAKDAPPSTLIAAARPLWESALQLAEQNYQAKESKLFDLMGMLQDKADEAEGALEAAKDEAQRLAQECDEKAAYAEELEAEVEEKEKLRLKTEEELAKAKAEIEALKAQLQNSSLLDELREFMRRSENRQASVATTS